MRKKLIKSGLELETKRLGNIVVDLYVEEEFYGINDLYVKHALANQYDSVCGDSLFIKGINTFISSLGYTGEPLSIAESGMQNESFVVLEGDRDYAQFCIKEFGAKDLEKEDIELEARIEKILDYKSLVNVIQNVKKDILNYFTGSDVELKRNAYLEIVKALEKGEGANSLYEKRPHFMPEDVYKVFKQNLDVMIRGLTLINQQDMKLINHVLIKNLPLY